MTISRPTLTIQKTPHGGVFVAGDPITFSIAVTNNGPGAAQNVRFFPADNLPDPNASLNWTILQQPAQGTCSITGPVGTQVLNCNFGNIPAGTTVTVSVRTLTQADDPGDCGNNGVLLNNSATVVGDNTDPATDSGSLSCKQTKPIPTLSQWNLLLLMILFGATGCAVIRRYR